MTLRKVQEFWVLGCVPDSHACSKQVLTSTVQWTLKLKNSVLIQSYSLRHNNVAICYLWESSCFSIPFPSFPRSHLPSSPAPTRAALLSVWMTGSMCNTFTGWPARECEPAHWQEGTSDLVTLKVCIRVFLWEHQFTHLSLIQFLFSTELPET